MNPSPRHAEDLLRIMDLCFRDLGREWKAGDVARELELSMSKTNRLLNTIAEHGYLEKTLGNTYRPGMKLVIIGRTFQRITERQQQQIETESFAKAQGFQL